MKWQRWLGIAACIILIISCAMHWTWYPDIKEYFSGFYSRNNYYGRPGILLCTFAAAGVAFYILKKNWSDRLNMILAAIASAYAITSFLRFASGYDGFVPGKQAGIYLMLISTIIHLVMAVMVSAMVKTQVPLHPEKENKGTE